jgi:hypothetical protein
VSRRKAVFADPVPGSPGGHARGGRIDRAAGARQAPDSNHCPGTQASSVFLATYTEDCELTAPGFTGKGRQELQEFWLLWMGAFPIVPTLSPIERSVR